MLTPDQFDTLTGPLLELFESYQQSVINDIARRLVKMGDVTATAAWQVQRLSESGAIYGDILDKLAGVTGRSEAELRRMFADAGVKAMKFDDAIYRRAGLNPLPLNLSPAMLDVLAAGLSKTGGIVRNLTLSTAISGQNAFIEAADLAYMQVSTGTMSYTQAIREGVKRVAGDGLTVIQYAGRADQLDVALRRALLTGIGQTTGELQMRRADEMGCDLVQTTAHAGARPAHALWQGQVFSRSGTHPHYPPFVETTGYGSPEGLLGINCRHHFYPFFEGVSEPAYDPAELEDMAGRTVTYNGHQMPLYQASQRQRAIERSIRNAKRQQAALEAAGLNAGPERARVRDLQARMREYLKEINADLKNRDIDWRMQRQREREQI
ncbi:MAG TPA: phage minor capsid protein [Anaerolineaceae bacterium]|nr:phage minor capsid protein [Anaerolineaceae bacterium]